MIRSRDLALLGLLIVSTMGRPLGAQQRSALDVGFTVMRFPDESATVAGPSVGWSSSAESRRLFGQISAGGVGTLGAATGSTMLTGGARAPLGSSWLVEGAGELYGAAGSASRSAATASAAGRVLRLFGPGGAWARGTVSVARRESPDMLPGRSLETGAWWSWSRARLTASYSDQHAKGQLFTGPFRDRLLGTVPVRYTEGLVSLHLESDAASLDLTGGVRRDVDAERLFEPVVAVTAAFWQSATRALTVSVTRLPPDFVRGADAARSLSVGFRFREPTPAMARANRIRPIVQVSGSGDARMVHVRAAGARRVELMADFTDWEPVTLTPNGDTFEKAIRLSGGAHRVVVRIDGGPWRPAVNTPAADDDLGGRVGLLVAP